MKIELTNLEFQSLIESNQDYFLTAIWIGKPIKKDPRPSEMKGIANILTVVRKGNRYWI